MKDDSSKQIRYTKPKLMLFDLPSKLTDALQAAGYNASEGTLGQPYRIKRSDDYVPVIPNHSFEGYSEQEIVLVDLKPRPKAAGPGGEKMTSAGECDWFAKASDGYIDPRPRVMVSLQDDSKRIYQSGGVFVIFADDRASQEYILAHYAGYNLQLDSELHYDNWSILPFLNDHYLTITADRGTEITVREGHILSDFLNKYLPGTQFAATFTPEHELKEDGTGPSFFLLAENKFGDPVSCCLVPRNDGDGWVFVLPQLADKMAAAMEFIETILPGIVPKLFPEHEGSRWVQRDAYEHAAILKLKAEQLEVQRRADEQVSRLDAQISEERERLSFLHGLLTKSGEELVSDVRQALMFIGFSQVLEVDDASGENANKQEDLQVLDKSPSLLIEVKGLSGMPTEGNTQQIVKYVLRRSKQWGHTDVIGLSLINCQRHLPALDRSHGKVFTAQQLQDAEANQTGLMTTWDLFRLIRGLMRWEWPAEKVRNVFYMKGRVSQTPEHYCMIGHIAHYWSEKHVVSIELTNGLCVGDRVGYLFDSEFFEEAVTSLQINSKSVSEAGCASRVGMKTNLKRRDIPVGTIVYRVG